MKEYSSSHNAELVFIPSPFTGHIVSTLEFAKVLVDRDPRISVTIFLIKLPFDPNANDYADALPDSVTRRRIRFVPLPNQSSGPGEPSSGTPSTIVQSGIASIAKYKHGVRDLVATLKAECDSSNSTRLAGFVVDMFCWPMMDVADEFGIPCYVYYTSNAAFLSFGLHFQAMMAHGGKDLTKFNGSDKEFSVPSFVNPVRLGKVMPSTMSDKEQSVSFFNRFKRFRDSKGILINTFPELESHAVGFFLKGMPDIPPVYPVGPILNLSPETSYRSGDRTEEIMTWLDEQPPLSVVFLCFGSLGSFDAEQVTEIAYGLECSGYRFLWSLRQAEPKEKVQSSKNSDPEEVLPEGFLRRTVKIGKVMTWAPQAAVLSHSAIGGFVSHCGWNSILESLWFGVPISTWPMYAEQQLNAFTMVRELGLATELTMEYRRNLEMGTTNFVVSREEVERGIRRVMEQDSQVRKKVQVMKEKSRKAVMEGGSSFTWMRRFIDDVIANVSS